MNLSGETPPIKKNGIANFVKKSIREGQTEVKVNSGYNDAVFDGEDGKYVRSFYVNLESKNSSLTLYEVRLPIDLNVNYNSGIDKLTKATNGDFMNEVWNAVKLVRKYSSNPQMNESVAITFEGNKITSTLYI